DLMGLEKLNRDDDYLHYQTVGEEKHHILIARSPHSRGRFGIGKAHHIVWSVPDLDKIKELQRMIQEERFNVTDVRDINYFKSIDTSEAGNIVFEFAPDGPGFDIDEDVASLGTALKLQEQDEHRRQEYETLLPKLDV